MIDVVTSPDKAPHDRDAVTIFLGGSIEAGKARDWQAELIVFLRQIQCDRKIQVYNPRRQAWDASWPMNDPEHAMLKEQILWELEHQDKADILIYYFAANTISPITLLELGIYAQRQPIIFIERDYLRYANVKITADHFGWDYYTDEQNFHAAIIEHINHKTDI